MKESHNENFSDFIQCEEYCHFSTTEQLLYRFAQFIAPYVPLNPSEELLISKYPVITFTAYSLSRRTYNLCAEVSEKDACQHFVWPVLLVKHLGEQWAQTILNAHEDAPEQSNEARIVDYYNNQVGLEFAKSVVFPNIRNHQLNRFIMSAFFQYLKEGKFKSYCCFTGPGCCFSVPNS